MEALLEQIINGLLCTDTQRIREATNELGKAYESPETLPALYQIVVSQREPQVRQFAAVLLNKRLQKLRNWQMVPADQKESIKTGMLQALINEKEKSVKNAIAQFIGSLVRHEEDKKDSWLAELLNFLYSRCSLEDPKESELGSSIFATLTDAAPDQFVNHMDSICQMYAAVLLAAEAKGNLATPTVANITLGMTYLMPFVAGHTGAEQTVLKVLPLIIKSAYAFAQKGDDHEFAVVFDFVDNIAEYSPKLLNNNLKPLIEFCLETANNKQIDDAIRIQVITFIGRVARIKKKVIVKQKLLEPILTVVFEMMCTDIENAEDDFYYESSNNTATAATQTLDLLAINMSPEKLIQPMLQLLEPALQNPDPLRRRGAFLCLAVIAEGCADAITSKYLEVMLNIIKGGIVDNEPIVRTVAFYALGQFSEHLQPEITKFAPQILPVLFEFLHQLVIELKAEIHSSGNSNDPKPPPGKDTIQYINQLQIKRKSVLTKYRSGQPEPKHTDRMFYALETYCHNLEDEIVPHLPVLMECLFETLDPLYSVNLRVLSLSALASVANSAKEHLMPYFPKIVSILQVYLVKECEDNVVELRNEAIETLSTVTRVVGKQNFIPFANDTMAYCLMMLQDGPNDPELKRGIYGLIASLSLVVNESMSTVFPTIMDRIIESIISSEDTVSLVADSASKNLFEDPIAEHDIDLDNTDDEDDDEDDGYQVENDYLFEKEEAILSLKEFAANTGSAFAPYLQTSFEHVYKVIDHPHEVIRKAAIETICAFITALHKMNDADGVKRACLIVMPKFAHFIRNDEDQTVVVHLFEVLGELFNEVQSAAVPNQEIADLIFACIKDVLNSKMACQFNEQGGGGDEEDPDDSEFDEMLIESAGNMFPGFGKALTPEIFSMYFGRLCQFYLNKLTKAKRSDVSTQRTFVYGALSDCFQSLGNCVVTYFDTLCPILIAGTLDPEPMSRQNCYYGLGELVLHAEEKSFESFPAILQALSVAIASEKNPGALDNICGAVARLIVTNYNMVPLAQVLPVFISNLPLREDLEENDIVNKAFRLLYMQARESILGHLEQILAITIDVLYKNQISNEDAKMRAIAFVRDIREQYVDSFNNVANSNPEVFKFLQTL